MSKFWPTQGIRTRVRRRDEKLGGFHSPLPLYRTETHLCSCQQRGAAQMEQYKDQETKPEHEIQKQSKQITL
jgi:hypothetical protein